jgi:hypothetical protein
MKIICTFMAAAIAAGLLASCTTPYATETGGTAFRTSGAYSASHFGAGSTYHSRDMRDPTGDWRHDDLDDEDDDDDTVAYRNRYIESGPRPITYRTWRPGMGPAALPNGSRRVMIGGRVYYTHGSTWYQPVGTGFTVVANPYY